MKKVYVTQNYAELYLLNDNLLRKQIQTLIKNEHPPAAGEITRAVAWPELWVLNDADYEQAKALVSEFLNQQQQRQAMAAWQCPDCGESVPGHFVICWQCGHVNE